MQHTAQHNSLLLHVTLVKDAKQAESPRQMLCNAVVIDKGLRRVPGLGSKTFVWRMQAAKLADLRGMYDEDIFNTQAQKEPCNKGSMTLANSLHTCLCKAAYRQSIMYNVCATLQSVASSLTSGPPYAVVSFNASVQACHNLAKCLVLIQQRNNYNNKASESNIKKATASQHILGVEQRP